MQVTNKQSLVFKVEGKQDFVLRPSIIPVAVPDYIRTTLLYKLALSDGTIQEFTPVPAPVAPPADADANAIAEADKAAADAKAKADADADAKAKAEAKVAAEIEAAKADLAKNDKKAK